jgi:hypothetical protein
VTDSRSRSPRRQGDPAREAAEGAAQGEAKGGGAIEHWLAWKRHCALGLCDAAAQQALRGFARHRFFRYVRSYAATAGELDAISLTPEAADAWHCFEAYLRLRSNRAGKSYKEWLFSRTDPAGALTLDVVQGGATLLMRDVVREHLRREVASHMVSLDAPLRPGRGEGEPSLAQLLPSSLDTLDEVERRELEAMAGTEAAAVESSLGRRQRVALLAHHLGLSLAHAQVTEAAGCGKSLLFTAHRDALVQVAETVRSRHPGEGRDTQAALSILALRALLERMVEWGRSENACRRFFLGCEP